ncbi:MAG TPA: HAD family hydrolase [Thermoplasmata archaeon]|nr:HAD family hydrolase [Thermoplasmata archaeon]
MPRLRAVLFDVDGTLLDTRDAWVAAFDAGLAAIGAPGMPGTEGARWIGTPIEAIYAERCGLSGDPLRTAVAEFQRSEAESVRRGVRSFPGVPEMLASLRPWRLGAITNKRHDTTLAALGAANLGDRFAIVLGGDSVARKKPAPDPVLQAARELGIPAESCAVVGDTEVDVHAGREAGAVTVGVTWGYGIRARLEDAGVGYLVETPAALPPLLRALTPSTGT